MQQVELKAVSRGDLGRARAKKLRRTGVVPAVLYGPRTKPLALQVDAKELGKITKRGARANLFIELQMDDSGKAAKRLALLQEVQQHPTSDKILHVDFREISMTEKLTTRVAVVAVGEPPGVKEGGVLNQVLHELTLRCLPKDLPDRIEVDVSKLTIGKSIPISELTPPANVEIVAADKTAAVFAVVAPMAEEEVATTEAAPGEPEVLKEKKVEGEEGAAAEGEKKGDAKKPAAAGKGEAKPAAAGKAEAGKAAPAAKAGAAAKPEAKGAPGKK